MVDFSSSNVILWVRMLLSFLLTSLGTKSISARFDGLVIGFIEQITLKWRYDSIFIWSKSLKTWSWEWISCIVLYCFLALACLWKKAIFRSLTLSQIHLEFCPLWFFGMLSQISYGTEYKNLGFLYILEQLFTGYMRRSKSKSEHQMVSPKVSEVILGSSKGAHYPLPFLAYIWTNLKSG